MPSLMLAKRKPRFTSLKGLSRGRTDRKRTSDDSSKDLHKITDSVHEICDTVYVYGENARIFNFSDRPQDYYKWSLFRIISLLPMPVFLVIPG
jgi:hypothetical protein